MAQSVLCVKRWFENSRSISLFVVSDGLLRIPKLLVMFIAFLSFVMLVVSDTIIHACFRPPIDHSEFTPSWLLLSRGTTVRV